MASEYIKWQLRDLEEKEAPRPLTRKEKILNWFHYHKWHLVVGAAGIGICAEVLKGALGIGKVLPDYQIAYVGAAALPSDTAAALAGALSSLGEDANGDGRVLVQINQYVRDLGEGSENAAYNVASQAMLMADFEDCESYFFLLEDPEGFEADYQILAHPDGTLDPEGAPAREDASYALSWTDCPVLSGLSLGTYTETIAGAEVTGDSQDLLSSLSLARRGFWTEKTSDHPEACGRLWEAMTRGASY